MKTYVIEIAANDFNTASAAIEGGADRIELCSALSEGGLTPSYATIKKCRKAFNAQLFPIIRPRAGDFLYNEAEFEIMRDDIKICKILECDGVVIGMLDKYGNVDKSRVSQLINEAYPMDVTFHRAFDRCRDPFEAMEQLIDIGCQRILTSGQQTTAIKGTDLIASLIKKSDERIIIMPGSGIRPDNINDLAMNTGSVEFHSSLRSISQSKMDFRHPSFAGSEESYTQLTIDAEEVRNLRRQLK